MQIDPTEPHPARRYRAGQNEAAKLNRFRCRSRRLSPPVVAREQDVRSGNSPFFDDFACLFGERCLSAQPGVGDRKLPASPQCGGCGRRFCAFGNEVLLVKRPVPIGTNRAQAPAGRARRRYPHVGGRQLRVCARFENPSHSRADGFPESLDVAKAGEALA